MKLCDYGCGQEAHFPFKNGKWCCSESYNSCPNVRKKRSKLNKGKILSIEIKRKMSKSHKGKKMGPRSKDTKRKQSKSMKGKNKLTIEQIKEQYPFFSKIEEMRYNPNIPLEEKEIQVHCKNHECENSKEKGGWFTPTSKQIIDRKNMLDNEGEDKSSFYCCQECKDTCILFGLRGDPYKNTNKPYTSAELDTFNKHILKRDDEICYYCGEHHATIVHHLRPQKLEPFFALDPDYAVSVCKKCHYEKGHPTGSEYSTGNLAKIVCSVESQKFLNQK